MIYAFIEYEYRNFKKDSYLLCGGNFFYKNFMFFSSQGYIF